MTARFPDKPTFEVSISELECAALVDLFVCTKNGVRCFEIVDYQTDAPAQLLRRNKTPSDWHRPSTTDDDGQRPPVTASDGQRRTVTDSGGRSAANGPQVPENTTTTPAPARVGGRSGDPEKRDERGETRDLPIADTRARSAANASQSPEIPYSNGQDRFAQRWDASPPDYNAARPAEQAWLEAVGEARDRLGVPWGGAASEHLRKGLSPLLDAFGVDVLDAAMHEHVRIGKALGQRGETPLRFLRSVCEQEREKEQQPKSPRDGWAKRKETDWERHTRLHGPAAQRRKKKEMEALDAKEAGGEGVPTAEV
jgi:hypothetical protein